jgi:hypothetical protein
MWTVRCAVWEKASGHAPTRIELGNSAGSTKNVVARGNERKRPDMEAPNAFDLERFVTAQAPVFAAALDELKNGHKRSHWMWFVFPQLRLLGSSSMAKFYGIGSLREARDYLAHPLLGPRLVLCTEAVLAIDGKSLSRFSARQTT